MRIVQRSSAWPLLRIVQRPRGRRLLTISPEMRSTPLWLALWLHAAAPAPVALQAPPHLLLIMPLILPLPDHPETSPLPRKQGHPGPFEASARYANDLLSPISLVAPTARLGILSRRPSRQGDTSHAPLSLKTTPQSHSTTAITREGSCVEELESHSSQGQFALHSPLTSIQLWSPSPSTQLIATASNSNSNRGQSASSQMRSLLKKAAMYSLMEGLSSTTQSPPPPPPAGQSQPPLAANVCALRLSI